MGRVNGTRSGSVASQPVGRVNRIQGCWSGPILHDYAQRLYSHATMTADPSASDAHLDLTWPPARGEWLCPTASLGIVAAASGVLLAVASRPLAAASGVRR